MANELVRFNVAAVTILPDESIANVPLSMFKAEVLEASAHVVGLALVIVPALRVRVSVEASPRVAEPTKETSPSASTRKRSEPAIATPNNGSSASIVVGLIKTEELVMEELGGL